MKTEIKRISALIALVVLLIVNFNILSSAETPDTDVLTSYASTLIYRNEGSYTSVNPNDCGALSIGKVQWHAGRALGLLRNIISLNNNNAKSILGEKLFNEINATESNWSNRVLTSAEASVISKLLGTDEGRQAQDTLAYTDISGYINHGKKLGITDGKALVYFADIENQGGYGTAGKIASAAAEKVKSYGNITLDILHTTALEYMSGYSRRMKSYNYCDGLVFNEHLSNGVYNVVVSDINAKGCNITFGVKSEIDYCIVYVWDSSEKYSAQYKVTPSNATGSVKFKLSDTGYSVSGIGMSFKGKIMAFKNGQQEPYSIYENLSYTLKASYGMQGDVNGDSSLNTKDARLVLKYCAKLEKFNDEQIKYADVNSDLKISVKDARLILRVIAKLATF